ncbi:uncharacterized protein C8Q71DRAFT_796864 [Rhodofomes roseus]|uniref:ATP-dependent DNA helicase n=1 Tax=Rhodofomes roseus TaxID=34475 RepID=A0ABQ8KHA2_9APHY|nr:uncharacterized protein C8Q71DRAFT_796864 [Rhodofomes roseus]KAH9836674.1 hypothetical protein C8Q71DRAFT_796864 [Rhodofomes roseus]
MRNKFELNKTHGKATGKPKLHDPNFQNVSMILSYNSHRDRINELGVTRFAKDTGQTLETFYSLDHYGSPDEGTRHNKSKKNAEVKHKVDKIHPHLQEQLWMLPHKDTNNHPGKLSLCIGLPVMIKANEATECNVTNGAEAIVVGWASKPLTGDKRMLEVVFVKLTAAPTPVKLDGLPENAVPIAAQSMKIPCLMPNGHALTIHRTQVALIPNFAMTDFSSQGRTRPYNVVDLQNFKNHQSVYNCLSHV